MCMSMISLWLGNMALLMELPSISLEDLDKIYCFFSFSSFK